MTTPDYIALLSLFTLLAVLVFAMVSKWRTEARRRDPDAPKSTLAKDGPQGGLAPLQEDDADAGLHREPYGSTRPDAHAYPPPPDRPRH